MEPIKKASDLAGGPAALAKTIGVKAPTVYQWINKKRPVPAGRCLAIEHAVSGAVTTADLRPDIFGPTPLAVKKEKPRAA